MSFFIMGIPGVIMVNGHATLSLDPDSRYRPVKPDDSRVNLKETRLLSVIFLRISVHYAPKIIGNL